MDVIDPRELDQFFTLEELARQRRENTMQTFFWQNKPFLPAEDESGMIHLYHWGNRERTLKLPRTGWARLESVQDGGWDYLSPKKVWIPSLMGYEKNKWFKTPAGISGIRVRYHNVTRVYILTVKATQTFLELTHHDRMPIIL